MFSFNWALSLLITEHDVFIATSSRQHISLYLCYSICRLLFVVSAFLLHSVNELNKENLVQHPMLQIFISHEWQLVPKLLPQSRQTATWYFTCAIKWLNFAEQSVSCAVYILQDSCSAVIKKTNLSGKL